MRMKTTHVSVTEGSDWIAFEDFCRTRPTSHEGKRIHAVKFEDGSIWDACNGWRDWTAGERSIRFPDTFKG